MKRIFALVVLLFCFLVKTNTVLAAETKTITIVNPVRISQYNNNPGESINAQYKTIEQYDLKATWLFTFDAIDNQDIQAVTQRMNSNQEFGIFLEVTKNLCEQSGVIYNDLGAWHRASSVFLSGYTQEDRKKLIDTLFDKFKARFGYYPVSVGSWWTDSFSQKYLHDKYGVSVNLAVSDQYSTDGYQIWGQYWGFPYYSSIHDAAMPSEGKGTGILNLQWAPRDPLNGYYSSLFSTQDYLVATPQQDTDYFKRLIMSYLTSDNSFANVVVGLEADLSANAYSGEFSKQMEIIDELTNAEDVRLLNMNEVSNLFAEDFSGTPTYFQATKDLLNSQKTSFWYQSPKYRIGIVYDASNKALNIRDLRVYDENFVEPYYEIPNENLDLRINLPSALDETSDSETIETLNLGELSTYNKDSDRVEITFKNGKIVLDKNKVAISGTGNELKYLNKSDLLAVRNNDNGYEILFRGLSPTQTGGLYLNAVSPEGKALLHSKKLLLAMGVVAVVLLLLIYKAKNKFKYIFLALIIFLGINYLFNKNYNSVYWVSPDEVVALSKFKQMPSGKILIYDFTCLQCSWHGQYKPSVFGNNRGYISKLTGNEVLSDSKFLNIEDLNEAKLYFNSLNVDYIYLVNYEGYQEKLPFSPGDFSAQKVYHNANAEIWRIKR